MSYCVNCGVELAQPEKKCPLCGVPVINPIEPVTYPEKGSFPQRRELLENTFDRQLWIKLVSIVIAVPAVICFVSNLLFPGPVFWSLYVIGALAVIWTFCVSPFMFKSYFPLLWIVANTIATLGYLYLIEYLTPGQGWWQPLALPVVLGVAVLSLIIILLIRYRIFHGLYTAAGIFMAAGLLCVLVELSINYYITRSLLLSWSWFSLISCTAVAGALMIIQRQLHIKEKLKRRLHF